MRNILFIFLLLSESTVAQDPKLKVDTLEFQTGYLQPQKGALEQLKTFPSPRYVPHNDFIRLYNWMSPYYAGGAGQPGITEIQAVKNAVALQEELGMNWNYFLVISNPRINPDERNFKNPNTSIRAFADLANRHPEIPLGVTTFWEQLSPKPFGRAYAQPNVIRSDLPPVCYINDTTGKFTKKVISYAAPDSLFIQDGIIQRKELELLLKHLTRPINFITENGEEPPKPYSAYILKGDPLLTKDKENLRISNWAVYIATKKKHTRQLYSSQFMDSIPQLKNTHFSFYQIEGGPIDRFNWNISRSVCTKIKGNYYSTPDFYPRTPGNWKTWRGAWHGWKWINDGRITEIKAGDKFSSPFIAAGWSNDPEKDIRPAQWLGLLKCLNTVGAEFFYTGYFNLKKPFSRPEDYIWQIAMPAYAQAIATHYSDIFRNGNVLFDAQQNPIITYPNSEPDVLVTVRKKDQQQQYVIACTVQPNSNTESSPLQKNTEIRLDGETLKINARRQGSVYIYDKTVDPPIFYQLDKWQQYEHPSRWRKYWINEAEVFDTACTSANKLIHSVYLKTDKGYDLSYSQSFIQLNKDQWVSYTYYKKDADHLQPDLFFHAYVKSEAAIHFELEINGQHKDISEKSASAWKWVTIPISNLFSTSACETIKLTSHNDLLMVDKVVIDDSGGTPELKGY